MPLNAATISPMLRKIVVLLLVFAVSALRVSADELQTARPQQPAHPYKWQGLIMIGIGGLMSLAAADGIAALEGSGFQACRADAASRGIGNDCLDQRVINPSLAGIGIALMAGGALIGLQRPARTPQIQFGRGRLSVSGRISF